MCSEFIYPIASCSSAGVTSLPHAHSRGPERGKRSVRQNPLRMESGMVGRSIVVIASVLAAWAPALAGELKPEDAKKFIAGKYFSYTCFEGTAGAGRINADGSVVGTIQIRGAGPAHLVALPTGTIR